MEDNRIGPNVVISNPSSELAVFNAKAVRNCTELYLANRQIDFIGGFEIFVNLEVLWLNNNKVTDQ